MADGPRIYPQRFITFTTSSFASSPNSSPRSDTLGLYATITVGSYDPSRPQAFAGLGRELRTALGEVALAIHHIGSTSVPGLAAKDVIDIQVTVRRLELPFRVLMAGTRCWGGRSRRRIREVRGRGEGMMWSWVLKL